MLNFTKNPVFKNIAFLLVGTGSAQVIALCATPFVTRLYMPKDYGVMASCLAVTGILSSFITLSYELSIPLAKSDDDATKVLLLGIAVVLTQTLISIILLFLLKTVSPELFLKFKGYLWFIPIIFLFNGAFQLLYYWAVRFNLFKLLASTRVKQSFSMVIVQVGLGFAKTGATGLLLGQLLNQSVGIVTIAKILYQKQSAIIFQTTFYDLVLLGKQFIKFPLYNCPATILNRAGVMIAPVIIMFIYGSKYAGLFGMIIRLISLPIGLIGQAISQVYYREACLAVSDNFALFEDKYNATMKWLLIIAIFGVLPSVVIIYYLIPKVLGSTWVESRDLLLPLTPMMLSQFVIGSLGQTLSVLGKQNIQLLIDIIRVLTSIGAFFISYRLNLDFENCLLLYSAGISFALLLMLLVIRLNINCVYRKLTHNVN